MTSIGKKIRMERIFDRISKNTIIVPMIHGVSVGQAGGITDMSETVDKVTRNGANAVVIYKGEVAAGHRGRGKDVGLIVHVSPSNELSDDPDDKGIVCSVKEAVSLGADAVSIRINLENGKAKQVLGAFTTIVDQSNEYGIPLLAMVHPSGSAIEKGNEYGAENVGYCAQVADELGADVVVVNYTGSPETFRPIVAACKIPVVIADGPKMGNEKELLEMVKGAMTAGAAGLSVGPIVSQRDDLTTIVGKMNQIVHKGAHVEDFYPQKTGLTGSFWGDE